VIENLVMEATGILKNARLPMGGKSNHALMFFVTNVVQIAVYGRQSIHDNEELNKDYSIGHSCSLCLCNFKSAFVEVSYSNCTSMVFRQE
jgi:bacterioferritin-associated ferredoxin